MSDVTTGTIDAAPKPVNIEQEAARFIALRDLKNDMEEEHKARVAPVVAKMEELKVVFSTHLAALNVDSMKTSSGTITFKTKVTASISDASAFWNYVVTQGMFELIDKRANVTAVSDFVEANGVPPPGVNYNTFRDVGVTRPRGK